VFPTEAWTKFERDWVMAICDYPQGRKPSPQVQAAMMLYGVKAFPTMVIVGPDGKELGRFVGGARTAADYIGKLEGAIGR